MASEKYTLRLSAKDTTEAEIIAILNGKPDGRKASWLRDVLVIGYRAMRGTDVVLPGVNLNDMSPPSVTAEPKISDQRSVSLPASDPDKGAVSVETSSVNVANSELQPVDAIVQTSVAHDKKQNKTGSASALAGLTAYADER